MNVMKPSYIIKKIPMIATQINNQRNASGRERERERERERDGEW